MVKTDHSFAQKIGLEEQLENGCKCVSKAKPK